MQKMKIDKPTKEAAIHHLIAERAYVLWENQGCPHGRDVVNWHQAEQEILNIIAENPPASTGNPKNPPSSARNNKRLDAR